VKLAALKREGKVPGPDEMAAIMRETAAEYDAKSDAYYATSELWDDGILDPVDTRNALGVALSVALNRPFEPARYGVLRI
jgi:3-methylcrotonyl-CoA carboxylase beta subunit